MKEFDDLMKSLTDSFNAFTKLIEKVSENLKTIYEKKEQPASSPFEPQTEAKEKVHAKEDAKKKPVLKAGPRAKSQPKLSPKNQAKKKAGKPETGVSITEAVQKAIENNPGINFKSLQDKTGFETKQIQNALPPLKKAGKIKSEGRGIYYPATAQVTEEQGRKIEETVE